MKKIITLLLCISLLVAVVATKGDEIVSYAETLAITAADTTAPELSGVAVYPTTVSANSQFTVTVSASDDSSGLKSVAVKVIGPSGTDTNQIFSEITASDNSGKWSANLLMPSSAENGTWKVGKVVLKDNNGNSKEYAYGSGISTTFAVTGGATNCSTSTTVNNQNKNNCEWSNGSWNSLTCTCTCPTNWYLGGGGSCVYMTSSTAGISTSTTTTSSCTDTGLSCTGSGGTWSSSSCSCACPSGYSLSGTSCAAEQTTVTTNCSTSTTVNNQNKNNCEWSNGSWDSSTCTCTCQNNYYLGSGGSCVYAVTANYCNLTSSVASDCTGSGGSWNTTTCACSCPTNYALSGTKCVASCVDNGSECMGSGGTWSSSSCACSCPTGYTLSGNKCLYGSTTCVSEDRVSCTGSGGSWSSTSCACTCPTSFRLDGKKCVISTAVSSCTNDSSSSCAGSGGSWSSTSCTCTCPANYTLSGTKCVANMATGCSTTSTTLNTQNKNNCVWSKGTWNSTNCSCTCPANYYLGGGGSCVAKTECTLTGSDCTSSGGTWSTSSCSCACPSGYDLSGNKCVAKCTADKWTCDNWSVCVDGKQYRPCTLTYDCPGVSQVSPRTEQECTVAEKEQTEATATSCYYKFSEYGSCINGKQTRKILSSYPEGCIDKLNEPLEKACTAVACSYKYSGWSECKDGKKTRSISSTSPEGCTPGNPLVEEACKLPCTDADWKCDDWSACGSEGTQYRKCSLSDICISSSTLKSPLTTRDCVYATIPVETEPGTTEQEAVPAECSAIGWTDKKDCELYLYHSRVVSDCRDSNLNSKDQCRQYFLSKYGKPLKCEGLSEDSCNSLIDNVILADLKTVIASDVKEKLAEVAGNAAVVDIKNQTIRTEVVSVPSGQSQPVTQVKEVKVESLPITSSAAENVSVSLIPTATTVSAQQNLSPVAIAFDSDGDGLPDDVEKRLKTDPNMKDTDSDGYSDAEEVRMGTDPLDPLAKKIKTEVAGVDKAIVEGKALEQPKYAATVASASLAVEKVETVAETNALRFEGKAKPNQVVTLFIYSTMPIVVTVQADANGNWTYDLDKTMVDGTHEVYVAVNNDQGKIVESALPTPFFIAEAQAVSVDDFVASAADVSKVESQTNNMLMLYVLSGLAVVLILVAAFFIIKQRFAE